MIDIKKLAQESIDLIKFKYDIPKSGFIAGGCLANLIWEKVSGTVAAINDIDVYLFDKQVELNEQSIKEKQHYTHKESHLYDDYNGVRFVYQTKEFYSIDRVTRDEMINTIYYESTGPCPNTILKSFDINCCQIGYEIETGEFYWTKHFENFVNTGNLQVVNLGSPAHTAIRLVKKKDELNAKLDPIELDMIEYCIGNRKFLDSGKLRFKDRYADMYKKYQSELEERFTIERDDDLEKWLIGTKGISEQIWQLKRKSSSTIFDDDLNIGSIMRSIDFVFYARNIFGDSKLEKVWYNLNHLFNLEDGLYEYLDTDFSMIDLEFMNNLSKTSSRCVNNLKGLTLSKQLNIIKSLLKRYQDDPLVAIAILENHSVSEIENQDDFGMLLLELSVRKDILQDPGGKVNKLFGGISGVSMEDAFPHSHPSHWIYELCVNSVCGH
jgi:hypothetical protein